MPRPRAKYLAGAVLLLCWGLVVSSWLGRIIHALAEPGYPADQTLHMHAPTRDAQAEPSSPIYVAVDPVAGKFAIAEWPDLSRRWNSNSTYAGLLAAARPVDALPSTTHAGRVIFILHTHPKMASTTLRRSCWENLRLTCNVVSPKRDPVGYSNAKDLASLMQKCENTHHFCVMGWHFHLESIASPAKPVSFFHLFPYRDFGDWAESALKQVFVGHAEAGCNDAAKRLERCDGWLELDYANTANRLSLA